MRVAFFSPLPPAKSGISDYSAALLGELRHLCEVTAFSAEPPLFDPARFDLCLYQIGNNSDHEFCYQAALRWPGVAVLHEANLHHLIAALTIRLGAWDAYLREVEISSGAAARQYADEHVRTLQRGPDYEGVPMLRNLLGHARGVIAHSRHVEAEVRAAGFKGPVAVIPHGAWLPPPQDSNAYRHRLGLNETTPIVGVFGHLKPYKRIAQSLRALRRLLQVVPSAKMILVGEPHPELQLHSLIESLELQRHVRVLGYTSIEDFSGYMAACNVVLNLRYPTVGENSGTLMRAMGLGLPVVVSDAGSFRELPDDVCLKAPVDASEEDLLFEYLNLLVSRPSLARRMGERAREWVAGECSWPFAARRYAEFLSDVAAGREPREAGVHVCAESPEPASAAGENVCSTKEYIRGWAPEGNGTRRYVETHIDRLARTLELTPPGGPGDRILEMGAYMQVTPALKQKLGYGEVRGCYYGPAGRTDHKRVRSEGGEEFACGIDLFDAETDPFPYPDEYFTTVLCCELVEHLKADPMRMMAEINRVLKPAGCLVLTTPNVISARAVSAMLLGYHPGFFPAYIRPDASGSTDARHSREYAPMEVMFLFRDAGFETEVLTTGPFLDEPKPELAWVNHVFERYRLGADLRGDGIYAVGRKRGPVRDRYPAWLYSGGE